MINILYIIYKKSIIIYKKSYLKSYLHFLKLIFVKIYLSKKMPKHYSAKSENEDNKMLELTKLYISQDTSSTNSGNTLEGNTLEDKINECKAIVDYGEFYIDNSKTLFTDTTTINSFENAGKYDKSRLRLLKKLKERRDKKK